MKRLLSFSLTLALCGVCAAPAAAEYQTGGLGYLKINGLRLYEWEATTAIDAAKATDAAPFPRPVLNARGLTTYNEEYQTPNPVFGLDGRLNVKSGGTWRFRAGAIDGKPKTSCDLSVYIEGNRILQGKVSKNKAPITADVPLAKAGAYDFRAEARCPRWDKNIVIQAKGPGDGAFHDLPLVRDAMMQPQSAAKAAGGITPSSGDKEKKPLWLLETKATPDKPWKRTGLTTPSGYKPGAESEEILQKLRLTTQYTVTNGGPWRVGALLYSPDEKHECARAKLKIGDRVVASFTSSGFRLAGRSIVIARKVSLSQGTYPVELSALCDRVHARLLVQPPGQRVASFPPAEALSAPGEVGQGMTVEPSGDGSAESVDAPDSGSGEAAGTSTKADSDAALKITSVTALGGDQREWRLVESKAVLRAGASTEAEPLGELPADRPVHVVKIGTSADSTRTWARVQRAGRQDGYVAADLLQSVPCSCE